MKSCPPEYWIWLQTALGAGAKTDELLAYFGNPEKMYNAGSSEWRMSGLLTVKKIEKLTSISPSQTKPIFDECRLRGYKILTLDDEAFPERLKTLTDVPLVLYVAGDYSVLNEKISIAMVGTRLASNYGIETAQRLSYSLAKSGAVVVSGGALGIDSEAHAGAMLANGKTVAVLGCGLSVNYLKENAALRRAITRHGCLVTEYAPFVSATRASFPIRNRLISGLSLGTVVVEAGVKSGSLITADKALEQGRDLFAVPGDIVRSSFDGTNHLISQGAKPVFSAYDILCEYEYSYGEFIDFKESKTRITDIGYVDYRNFKTKKGEQNNSAKSTTEPNNVAGTPSEATEGKNNNKSEKIKNENKKISVNEKITEEKSGSSIKEEVSASKPLASADLSGVSKDAESIYKLLLSGGLHIDEIAVKSGLSMNNVLSALTELELEGLAEQIQGKKYIII